MKATDKLYNCWSSIAFWVNGLLTRVSTLETNAKSIWHTGAGVPSDLIGLEGDMYLRTTNGAYYQKNATIWGASIGTLIGPQGVKGDTGNAIISVGTLLAFRALLNLNVGDRYYISDQVKIYEVASIDGGTGAATSVFEYASTIITF